LTVHEIESLRRPHAMAKNAVAYVDALNLYYGAVRKTPYKWLDVAGWVQTVLGGDNVTVVRYFTARIKQRVPGDDAKTRQNVYLRALEADPRVDVRYGHFRSDRKWKALAERDVQVSADLFRPPLIPAADAASVLAQSQAARTTYLQEVLVTIDEEKGSDVNLGVHLVHDALLGHCEKALVVTNDGDLEEALRLAAPHCEIHLLNPSGQANNARLTRHAHATLTFDRNSLANHLLPRTVRAANGAELHCPREWR
jgi:hypothetical protein